MTLLADVPSAIPSELSRYPELAPDFLFRVRGWPRVGFAPLVLMSATLHWRPAAMGTSHLSRFLPPGRLRLPCYGKNMSAATGLDILLEPLSRCLDVESARRVIELRVAAPVQERIDSLAERANDGTLSDDERLEYEALINVADFISILQLKARQQLGSKIQ